MLQETFCRINLLFYIIRHWKTIRDVSELKQWMNWRVT